MWTLKLDKIKLLSTQTAFYSVEQWILVPVGVDGKDSVLCVTLLLFQVTCDYSKSSTQQSYIMHRGLNREEMTLEHGEFII